MSQIITDLSSIKLPGQNTSIDDLIDSAIQIERGDTSGILDATIRRDFRLGDDPSLNKALRKGIKRDVKHALHNNLAKAAMAGDPANNLAQSKERVKNYGIYNFRTLLKDLNDIKPFIELLKKAKDGFMADLNKTAFDLLKATQPALGT